MIEPSNHSFVKESIAELKKWSFLEAVCQGSDTGMILIDNSLNVLFSNEKAVFFGDQYLNQDFKSGTSLATLPSNGRATAQFEKSLQKCLNFCETSEFEVDINSTSNALIWIGIKIKPIIFDVGIASGISIEINELTARRSIELELKRTRSFYETVLNNIPADIAVFDLDHNYLFVNLSAISNDELRNWLIGKNDFDYFERKGSGIEIAEARRAVFNKVIATKKTHESIDEHIRPDGSIAYKLRCFFPYTEQGELKLVIGYGIDVTELTTAQKTVMELLEKERGLSDLKTQFIQMASHEFRTPMASIQTSMDILKHYINQEGSSLLDVSPIFNRHHSRIEQEIIKITEIMNNILLMGRLDAGRMYFNPIENDISSLVKSIIEEELLSNSKREIKLNQTGASLQMNVDRSFISYMLKNLISNAFKYGCKNEIPEVNLEFYKDAFTLTVIDHGIGIPADEMKNLFQSFYRASNAENVQGTGLGLVIVKKLAEMHGGDVFGSSELNKGSAFGFKIPLQTYKRSSSSL
jgi:signal transduction histidine kinase